MAYDLGYLDGTLYYSSAMSFIAIDQYTEVVWTKYTNKEIDNVL